MAQLAKFENHELLNLRSKNYFKYEWKMQRKVCYVLGPPKLISNLVLKETSKFIRISQIWYEFRGLKKFTKK